MLRAFVVAALATLSSIPASAQNWTCTGLSSATCSISLGAGSSPCPAQDRVCIGGDSGALVGTQGCVCLRACTRSADCAGNETCSSQIGGHCTAKFACNTNSDCERDSLCTDGTCSRPGQCSTNAECPLGLPDCISGSCQKLAPGRCAVDAHCGSDPCAGVQRCDTQLGQCVTRGPLPCEAMPGGQCVATSATAFKCMVPACTTDAQCSSDPCAGSPQHCNVASGRCEPGDVPCKDIPGSACQRVSNASDLAYCAPPRPVFGVGTAPAVERIDPDEFEIIWTLDPSGPGIGGRGYVMRAWLPATVLRADAKPADLRFVVATPDRGMIVDGTLAAPGKAPNWIRDTQSGAWRWRPSGTAASGIDSVSVTPVAANKGRVRVEVRGRTIARATMPDAEKATFAAQLRIDWAGDKPYATQSMAAVDQCERRAGAGRSTLVACTGRPMPGK